MFVYFCPPGKKNKVRRVCLFLSTRKKKQSTEGLFIFVHPENKQSTECLFIFVHPENKLFCSFSFIFLSFFFFSVGRHTVMAVNKDGWTCEEQEAFKRIVNAAENDAPGFTNILKDMVSLATKLDLRKCLAALKETAANPNFVVHVNNIFDDTYINWYSMNGLKKHQKNLTGEGIVKSITAARFILDLPESNQHVLKYLYNMKVQALNPCFPSLYFLQTIFEFTVKQQKEFTNSLLLANSSHFIAVASYDRNNQYANEGDFPLKCPCTLYLLCVFFKPFDDYSHILIGKPSFSVIMKKLKTVVNIETGCDFITKLFGDMMWSVKFKISIFKCFLKWFANPPKRLSLVDDMVKVYNEIMSIIQPQDTKPHFTLVIYLLIAAALPFNLFATTANNHTFALFFEMLLIFETLFKTPVPTTFISVLNACVQQAKSDIQQNISQCHAKLKKIVETNRNGFILHYTALLQRSEPVPIFPTTISSITSTAILNTLIQLISENKQVSSKKRKLEILLSPQGSPTLQTTTSLPVGSPHLNQKTGVCAVLAQKPPTKNILYVRDKFDAARPKLGITLFSIIEEVLSEYTSILKEHASKDILFGCAVTNLAGECAYHFMGLVTPPFCKLTSSAIVQVANHSLHLALILNSWPVALEFGTGGKFDLYVFDTNFVHSIKSGDGIDLFKFQTIEKDLRRCTKFESLSIMSCDFQAIAAYCIKSYMQTFCSDNAIDITTSNFLLLTPEVKDVLMQLITDTLNGAFQNYLSVLNDFTPSECESFFQHSSSLLQKPAAELCKTYQDVMIALCAFKSERAKSYELRSSLSKLLWQRGQVHSSLFFLLAHLSCLPINFFVSFLCFRWARFFPTTTLCSWFIQSR